MAKANYGPIWLYIGVFVVMGVVAFDERLGAVFGVKERDVPSRAELQSQVDGVKKAVDVVKETVVPKMKALKEENASLREQVERDAVAKAEQAVMLAQAAIDLSNRGDRAAPEGLFEKVREQVRSTLAEKEGVTSHFTKAIEGAGDDPERVNALRSQKQRLDEAWEELEPLHRKMSGVGTAE